MTTVPVHTGRMAATAWAEGFGERETAYGGKDAGIAVRTSMGKMAVVTSVIGTAVEASVIGTVVVVSVMKTAAETTMRRTALKAKTAGSCLSENNMIT